MTTNRTLMNRDTVRGKGVLGPDYGHRYLVDARRMCILGGVCVTKYRHPPRSRHYRRLFLRRIWAPLCDFRMHSDFRIHNTVHCSVPPYQHKSIRSRHYRRPRLAPHHEQHVLNAVPVFPIELP